MATWTKSYFGKELMTKDGLRPTSEVLAGKSKIGVYFSAHWCPPCRGFTPVLAEFYSLLQEEDAGALEIVFVSSDSDDHSFAEYYGSMPWVAVPFSDRATKQHLAEKFGVRGIPFLVILDGVDGSVKDADARNTVVAARGVTSRATSKWS